MNKTVSIDVREDIRAGREPFSKIMTAVAALQPDEDLLVIAPFEPVPLFRLLEKQGFGHASKPVAGDWEARFWRQSNTPTPDNTNADGSQDVCGESTLGPMTVVGLDARRLEPPQPMIRILEALAELPANAQLDAHTDRRPMHLYAQLEERGYAAETQEQPDGSFLTHVRRR